MVWVLVGALAMAAPTFSGDDPGDARVAAHAWSAAIECTGWEAPHQPHVAIERGYVPGGYLGRAFHDDGLSLIEISAGDARIDEVIVHEVAHAWVSSGPTTLAEGRAELLADCITRRRPGVAPLQWDDGRDLTAMPDLEGWSTGHAHGPMVLGDARTDAYLGAARLMRAAATLVEPRALWAQDGLDWAGFRSLMEEAGPEGHQLLAVIDAPVWVQRAALSDVDRDGLPALVESFRGTDADVWDSDGDGWWDGATPPHTARPVPLDGSPVCLGVAGGDTPTLARVVTGGDLRGVAHPNVRPVHGAEPDGSILLAPGQPLVVAATVDASGVSGGLWASAVGDGLVVSTACQAGEHATVWSRTRGHVPQVTALVHAIDAVSDDADARWGPVPGRVAVALGSDGSTVNGPVVELTEADADDVYEAARLAVAVHRLWSSGQPDWGAARGIAHMLAQPR
ncbi:MAG: hypothetical protein ACI8PZ_004659 [Myxococcota bacterium]|jgi:hypothetical protein